MASRIILVVILCASAYNCDLADKQEGDVENSSILSIDSSKNENNEHCKSTSPSTYNYHDNRKDNSLSWPETSNRDTEDVIIEISDTDYYAMPQMFQLDPYIGCVKRGGVFCVGNFELSPVGNNSLFLIMKALSANWADYFNHTRIHRAMCLTRSCPPSPASSHEEWFESCVNAKMLTGYNLTARLYRLDYCTEGQAPPPPLSANEKAFAAFIIIILAFTAVSTILDVKLSEVSKKNHRWALSWSLYTSWKALVTPARVSPGEDLRVLDGLRVCCMLFVISSHVAVFNLLAYIDDTAFELDRYALSTMFVVNNTLAVQVFFMMSSFLLAQKLLRDKTQEATVVTFLKTMLNRFIRLSPSYFLVIWFSMTWWVRVDEGALWPVLVEAEKERCEKTWWLHFTYLDNSFHLHERCMIQSWYLTIDMQFYAISFALTLLLRKSPNAIKVLSILLVGVIVANLVMDYEYHIVPNFFIHNYQTIMHIYKDNLSMLMSYRSLLGNAASPLVGLLLAHAHVSRAPGSVADRLLNNKVFRLCTVLSMPVAFSFAWWSPVLLGAGPPRRVPAALLAAVERPVFISLVAVALFGAINGVDSAWRRCLSRAHVASRLTYGAYLLHLHFGFAGPASKHTTTNYDFKTVLTETFGILVWANIASLVLAVLVEFPTQALYKEIKNLLSGFKWSTKNVEKSDSKKTT